jgi:hypothetical protein
MHHSHLKLMRMINFKVALQLPSLTDLYQTWAVIRRVGRNEEVRRAHSELWGNVTQLTTIRNESYTAYVQWLTLLTNTVKQSHS